MRLLVRGSGLQKEKERKEKRDKRARTRASSSDRAQKTHRDIHHIHQDPRHSVVATAIGIRGFKSSKRGLGTERNKIQYSRARISPAGYPERDEDRISRDRDTSSYGRGSF